MDRREFFGASAAVGATIAAPRIIIQSFDDRGRVVEQAAGADPNVRFRLYHYGTEVHRQDVYLKPTRLDTSVLYGACQDIWIEAEEFSFDKMTVELFECSKVLGTRKEFLIELSPLQRYTITKGSKLTLSDSGRGFFEVS